jgi:hypothetical protein
MSGFARAKIYLINSSRLKGKRRDRQLISKNKDKNAQIIG